MPLLAYIREANHLRRKAPLMGALLVLSTLVATWLVLGVSIGEVARFVAFEILYVLLPGCVLYVALSPPPDGWLRVLGIGWPSGYALEIGAYALTSAIHARELFALYPLLILAITAPLVYVRWRAYWSVVPVGHPPSRQGTSPERHHDLHLLVAAMAVSFALALLAFEYFALYPLPGQTRNVTYAPDNMYDVSLAAEARNHWPITEPAIANEPLQYYVGVFVDVAAVNQVTGVSLSTVILRLLPSTVILIVAMQLFLLARSLGGSPWLGPVAVTLFLVVEEVNLDPTRTYAFNANFFPTIPGSPTYALGIVFYLGLLALVQASLTEGDKTYPPSRRRRSRLMPHKTTAPLVIFGILVLGAGATKMYAALDLLGGFGLFWVWCVATARHRRLASCYLAVSSACVGVVFQLLLTGRNHISTLRVGPLAFLKGTIFLPIFGDHSAALVVLVLAAVIVWAICTFAPLLGAGWMLLGHRTASPFVVLSLTMFLFGVAAYAGSSVPYFSQSYFLAYGYLALIPVASLGVTRLWSDIPSGARPRILGACAATLVIGLIVGGSTKVLTATGILTESRHGPWYVWYFVGYGIVAGTVVLWVIKIDKHLIGALPSRAGRVLACCIPLLGTLGLVKPLAAGSARLSELALHEPVIAGHPNAQPGMSHALYRGLIWVRDHTGLCSVLAVNYHDNDGRWEDEYYYYTAFTERRVFLEAWAATARGGYGEQSYPTRFALDRLATQRGSPTALRKLAQAGVSYVLIDKSHGGGAREPPNVSRLVFENGALDVYRLHEQPSGRRAGSRCS